MTPSHETPNAPERDAIIREVERLIGENGRAPEALIPILQGLQKTFRYLPKEGLDHLVRETEITPRQVTGVSTFYAQFRHHGAGQHLVQVCHGTACHVAGAEHVTDALRRYLNLKEGQDTSEDGLFTIERVACLGCCTLAPVMLIDDMPYGHLDSVKAVESLEHFLEEERAGVHRRRPEAEGRGAGLEESRPDYELRIGLNSCCIASGSLEVRDALRDAIGRVGASARVKNVGCTGMCHRVPLVEVVRPDGRSVLYGDSDPRQARRIVQRRLPSKNPVRRAGRAILSGLDLLTNDEAWEDAEAGIIDPDAGPGGDFLRPQVRIVTENSGVLDPLDLEETTAAGGYEGLRRAVTEMSPEETIDQVGRSGMRGRGGAGFSTAEKWRNTRQAPGERKFVVCNGDEGDPGAFMDRMLLEAYPHRIIEGMAIAAHAMGAHAGYVYVRSEYRLAVQRIETAIRQARERGFIGKSVCGTDFSFEIHIMRGAGAFVCGEETALIASIEGRRGMPRFRPPYPSTKGLWGCPTCVNNVETYATLPWIFRNGAEAFAAIGTEHSKGTKVFALAGRVARGGLIEVPMGATIWQIVYEIGGGIRDGRQFKAIQVGGPSGGCVPAWLAHTPIDYEALRETGAIMGSGGLVVMDDRTCMVDVARFFLDFTQKESCGRCTFCRIGTKRMLEILEKFCRGEAAMSDLEDLEDLAHHVRKTSLCGLGKTAPNPVLSTLRYFRHEYEAHVEGRCPAGKCPELIRYEITDACIGCTLCAQECPVGAIEPEPYEKHRVDSTKCVRCGSCMAVCPEDAVRIVDRRAASK